MTSLDSTARTTFPALGTTAEVVVTDHSALGKAADLLRRWLELVDAACSRFRRDSELNWLHDSAGTEVTVSPLLASAIGVALRAGRLSGGLVDPTVGSAVAALGYDQDFSSLPADDPRPLPLARPVPGWWRVSFCAADRTVLVPRTVRLDLGATAQALAADQGAERIAADLGCGVLVGVGGDVAVAGPAPDDGWRVGIRDSAAAITIRSGGLATSSTLARSWRRGGRVVHHIVDPRTGEVAADAWCTASVAAGSCVDANTASTAAIVLGWSAPGWLADMGLPGRLVGSDGNVVTVAGWPVDPH
jgi:thiamine biosynthesis lipoprotein